MIEIVRNCGVQITKTPPLEIINMFENDYDIIKSIN